VSAHENPGPEGGISVLELADLPAAQSKIMRLMLRKIEMAYPDLCLAIEARPEAERLCRADLDAGLEALNNQHWLNRTDGPEHATYKVNFRRRASRTLAKVNLRRQAGRALPADIWETLDRKKDSDQPPKTDQ